METLIYEIQPAFLAQTDFDLEIFRLMKVLFCWRNHVFIDCSNIQKRH